MRKLQVVALLRVALVLSALPLDALAEDSAQIVSVRRQGEVVTARGTEEAAVSRIVSSGDELRTDTFGRMSVLLPNQMLLKIAEETEFLYEGPGSGGVSGKIKYGKVWLRGQKQAVPFQVDTPTATAAIRGTEWYVEVARDGTTRVGVIDGVVEVSNALGAVELGSRDLALVEPGRAPVKLAYVTPPDAVNWTLNYFGLWQPEDFARGGPALEPTLRGIIDAYYASDLERAAGLLERANAHAQTAAYQAAHGFLLLVSGKSAEAATHFRRANELDPSWALPLTHLSLIALVENRREEATDLAGRAGAAEPRSAVAHIARAYALKGRRELDAAYAEAQRAVELSPEFQEALLIAAQIALEMERLGDARGYLERARDDRPPLGRKRTLEGFLALRTDKEEALPFFDEALRVEPDSPDALLGRGLALFRDNRADEAIDSITRATLLAPQVSDYQSYLAKAYAELGRDEEAEQVLSRAKRLDEKDPTPYLYEALIEQARFRPGVAFLKLLEARRRNDNRAVFRSQYLLDQDRSVVTSNLAQVYHEIGFDHSATQEAARALELDPTNQAAHRRQFFALKFDPRGYAQAESSERLLNNMFMPPTRSAVIVSEEFLSPYQNAFDRPGVDPVLRGRTEYGDEDDTTSRLANGQGLVAAQFDAPLAVSIDFGGGRTNSSSSGVSRMSEPKISSEDRDDDEYSGRAFAKWQPTTSTQIFGEVRIASGRRSRSGDEVREENQGQPAAGRQNAADMPPPPRGDDPRPPPGEGGGGGSGGGGGGQPSAPEPEQPPSDLGGMGPSGGPSAGPPMSPPDGPPGLLPPDIMLEPEMPEPPVMPSGESQAAKLDSEVDSDISDLDFGIHSKLTPDLHALANVAVHNGDDTVDTQRTSMFETLQDTQDTGFDFTIAQAALWQRVGSHFFQLGVREFEQDFSIDTSEEEEAGMPMRVQNGNDAELRSVFLVDQFTGIPDVNVTVGVNIDSSQFTLLDGRENGETEVGPSVGVAWEVVPATFLRGGVISNAAGDRNARLQQTLIAGFPWQRLTLIDPYSEEQLFHLQYETYVLAVDTSFLDPVISLGAEIEHDHQRTESFVESGDDERELTLNDSNRARIYVESLLTPQWATTFTYRYDSFELPDDTARHGIAVSTAYFTNQRLAFRLGAEYVNLESEGVDLEDGSGDQKGILFVPSIEGYPFNNRMRMNLRTPFTEDGDYSVKVDFFWYLTAAATP